MLLRSHAVYILKQLFIRWVHTSEVSRLKLWQELKYTCEHERLLTVISVHIRFQSILKAIEGVNQDTR